MLKEVTLTLQMAPDMEIEASKAASAMADFMNMSPDKVDEVRMAVVEACINAIEHSFADDRKVRVTFSVLGDSEPERLQITVRDAGIGFRPDDVEDPRIEDKLKAQSKRGWGLKIIRGLMDEVKIHSGAEGTVVIMSKSR